MGMPVKVSDQNIEAARNEATLASRSLAGQVDYWLETARSAEAVLGHDNVRLLRQAAQMPGDVREQVRQALMSVFAPGFTARVHAVIHATDNPVYEAVPGRPGMIAQVRADGSRTVGKMVNRQFVAE
jgi:hypothetical protein